MKVTTASDAWMSITERCCLKPVFWKRGQRRPTLFGESVDVPEDIVVDWSQRFLRLPVHPESHFSV